MSAEAQVLEKFSDRVATGNLERLCILKSVTGGMPGEGPVEEELSICGRSTQAVYRSSGGHPRAFSVELGNSDVQSLFELVGRALKSLEPRSRALFTPDTVLGSITIKVEGNEASFLYIVDEQQREVAGRRLSPEMADALQQLEAIQRKVSHAAKPPVGR